MKRRFSIVITRTGPRNHLPHLEWLREQCGVDEGEWIVMTPESWRALAGGEAGIIADLERKLMITFYVHQPDAIVVVGYPAEKKPDLERLTDQTRRVMERVGACLLPTEVLGFVVDGDGAPARVAAEEAVDADGWTEPDESSPLADSVVG